MRRHYYFRPSADGWDAWEVGRLVELSRAFPIEPIPLDELDEIDTPHWFSERGSPMPVRGLVWHCRIINGVDLSYPIILAPDGCVMDGMHRVARALLDGRDSLPGVRLPEMPDPDHRDCRPHELPWE